MGNQPPARLKLEDTFAKLSNEALPFLEVLTRHDLDLELFSPRGRDTQTPHERDELYLVASGNATLWRDGESLKANTGDVLFVPAGMNHRFESFSTDFSTWVIFFGPKLD